MQFWTAFAGVIIAKPSFLARRRTSLLASSSSSFSSRELDRDSRIQREERRNDGRTSSRCVAKQLLTRLLEATQFSAQHRLLVHREFINAPPLRDSAPQVKPRRLLRRGNSYHLPFVTCKFVHLDALAPPSARARARAPPSAFFIGVWIYRVPAELAVTTMICQKLRLINFARGKGRIGERGKTRQGGKCFSLSRGY